MGFGSIEGGEGRGGGVLGEVVGGVRFGDPGVGGEGGGDIWAVRNRWLDTGESGCVNGMGCLMFVDVAVICGVL